MWLVLNLNWCRSKYSRSLNIAHIRAINTAWISAILPPFETNSRPVPNHFIKCSSSVHSIGNPTWVVQALINIVWWPTTHQTESYGTFENVSFKSCINFCSSVGSLPNAYGWSLYSYLSEDGAAHRMSTKNRHNQYKAQEVPHTCWDGGFRLSIHLLSRCFLSFSIALGVKSSHRCCECLHVKCTSLRLLLTQAFSGSCIPVKDLSCSFGFC